ncbi:MAG: flavodoxin domain-containing protein [Oscillospiraceae bacterium]|nr:flavodoxin domain-containing protein [Oscillospiraceae bacterium]
MKTVVLYATKHGAAADIAKRIAAQFDDAGAYDIKNDEIPNLSDFDCIIIGSAVYAGTFRNEAKTFLIKNADELIGKKLGFFTSGMSPSESTSVFKANIPEKILQAATAVCSPGGAFNPENAKFFEKLIMKMVTKQSGPINTISDEKIIEFAEAMKE